MSNTRDGVVLFRVARDPDKDKDKDKDDDETSSSSVSASVTPTPAPTPEPKPPGPPGPPRPAADPSTLSTITQSSTSVPDSTAAPIQAPLRPDHFGPAESAGIGVGVAVAVLLIALVAWFIARRRRSSKSRKVSLSSTADTEVGSKELDPGPLEYNPVGVKELEAGRRASELAAYSEPVEVVGDPEFVAELQGSDIPVAGWRKPSRERLFADAPINETDEQDELGFSKVDDEKREPDDHKESDLSEMNDEKRDEKRQPDDHEQSDLSKLDDKKREPDDHEEPDLGKTDIKKQDS